MTEDLQPGIYERLISGDLAKRLDALAASLRVQDEPLTPGQAAARLSRHVRDVVFTALTALEAADSSPKAQLEVVNGLLLHLQAEMIRHGYSDIVGSTPFVTDKLLLALVPNAPIGDPPPLPRPSFSLVESHLLINSRSERQIGHELTQELGSADGVDLLCSFLLWSGYARLGQALRSFLARPGTRMRVLTTVYMGATEPRVLDELHKLGAELRVSYDTRRTRLHAKAWLFHRKTGYSSAYVGSSNLSAAALTDGLEWNVRMGHEAPLVLEKFASAFETYWNDESFEPYDPERDRQRLEVALRGERTPSAGARWAFDIRPYPFQEAILEKLEVERFVHGRSRNLVVAATGTGKTIIAAFDFKSLAAKFFQSHGRRPHLLFIAHRRELLNQARETFRAVLKDPEFGELLVDGSRPRRSEVLFASVQSLAQVSLDLVPANQWDVVIVDEFHHAEAPSYRRWLSHLTPWMLLGLTATPERGDGRDVREWFGGAAAIELRLWDAIEQGLLATFQYYGLKDPIDISNYWKRGQLDLTALDKVVTGHDVRALEVLRAVERSVADPRRMRAIGFCVGQGHAQFMAKYFSDHGLRAATALGGDPEREAKIAALRAGEMQALFTVDALSEGVDVPEIDTALFLRPTESPTVFLQQLGRGLRLSPGKRCLTVLDFVAVPNREFRLDRKYLALVGGSRRGLAEQIEQGFPFLPAGCSIQLTDDAREVVLRSVREALSSRKDSLIEVIRRLGPKARLVDLLDDTGLEIGDLYRDRSLTELRRLAGFTLLPEGPQEALLARGIARLRVLDDPELLVSIAADCSRPSPPPLTAQWKIVLATLVPDRLQAKPAEALALVWRHPELLKELEELLQYLRSRSEYVPLPFEGGKFVLQLHCHYRQEQILTALTVDSSVSRTRSQAGVVFIEEQRFDVFFVTINKTPERYTSSTMYKDYPLSRDKFHWQSMSSTSQGSVRGRRNIEHKALGVTPLLFVRLNERDEFGGVAPYCFLGPLEFVSADGERPISIVWRLSAPMPAGLYERARVVA